MSTIIIAVSTNCELNSQIDISRKRLTFSYEIVTACYFLSKQVCRRNNFQS